MLEKIELQNINLENGVLQAKINLFYEVFGKKIGTAPIVLVNHALTGNSTVTGDQGWWNQIIGTGKAINTDSFTVLAFNIPGNGFDGDNSNTLSDYKNFTAKDIASLFWKVLENLKVAQLFAVIGGSLGGGIAWEMAALEPTRIQNLIPIATDCKTTNWVLGNVLIQDRILNNSTNPIEDARLHAMLLYRTPKSINQKFNSTKNTETNEYKIENWLLYHGTTLKNRFSLPAYKLMNHLLKTIDIAKNSNNLIEKITSISATIHLIAIDSDLFFTAEENKKTYNSVREFKSNLFYHEINSIHGHDAFLIEYEQLKQILQPIFQTNKK